MSNHVGGPPDWLTAEYLQQVVRKAFQKDGLVLKSHSISPGSLLGDNYTGMILRIQLKVLDGNQQQEHLMIAKYLKPSPVLDALKNPEMDSFDLEIRMLRDVIPNMTSIIQTPVAPKLYYADPERKIMFLEDLCTEQFRLADKTPALDLDHTLLVVEALAKLHGAGLLLLKEKSELKEDFKHHLFTKNFDLIAKIITGGFDALLKALPHWPLPEETKQKLRDLKNSVLDKTYKAAVKYDDQLNSLAHTDCWVNNMMFRYENSKVKEVRLLDFQTSTYHSVAYELLYFIFSSVNADVTTQHLPLILAHYHQTLTKVAGPVITLEKLQQQVNDRFFFGLSCLLTFTPFIIKPKGQQVELDSIVAGEGYSKEDNSYLYGPLVQHVVKLIPLFEQRGLL